MNAFDIVPFEQPTADPPVRGFLHRPEGPCGEGIVLTHGAGSNCESPLMVAVAAALCETGFVVLRCDLPFRQMQPKGPPPRGSAPADQQGLRRAVEALGQEVQGRVFLGGHSYGGRQGSMLAAADPELISGLLLLSYPIHPPTRPELLRTEHFPQLRAPALFVHGSRDPFGSLDELSEAIKLIATETELLAIEGAAHDLLTGKNRKELPNRIAQRFRSFMQL